MPELRERRADCNRGRPPIERPAEGRENGGKNRLKIELPKGQSIAIYPSRNPQPKHTEMADASIEEKVKNIIVEQLGVNEEQVTLEAKFIEDLGADSLDTVELVMAFEEEFGIEVPDEEAEKLASVGDVVRYIESAAG